MKKIYLLLAGLLLIGTIQTYAQGSFSSNVASGNWNVPGSWTLTSGTSATGIPGVADAVTILNGNTITLTDVRSCASLVVGGGASGTFLATAGANLTDVGNLTINTGAAVQPSGGSNVLTIGGNIVNSGTFNGNTGGNTMDVVFNGSANQTVSGTGATTNFNNITVNNSGAANNNIVEILSTNFTAKAGFLTLTAGILKLSGAYTLTNTVFSTANYTIPAGSGIWLNNAHVGVTPQVGTATLGGLLRVTSGNYKIGVGTDNSLEYTGSASQIIMEGGILQIAGRLSRDANAASTTAYNQINGTVLVGNVGSASTTRALFEIANAGSSFTMGLGSIQIAHANPSFSADYFVNAGTIGATFGVLQIGTTITPAGQTIRINTTAPIGSLTVGSTNSPTALLVTNGLTVKGIVTISAGATFNANNLNISVARHWNNNGTFTAGTGTVTFNGGPPQTILGSSPTSFFNLTINTGIAGGVTCSTGPTVTNALTLTNGIVTTSAAALLTLTNNATVTGASDASFVSGPVKKIGNQAFTFPTGKTAGGKYQPIAISAPANITDSFTAEYIRSSATALSATFVPPVLNVSNCDYWTLTKNSVAPASIAVSLSWDANNPCGGTYVTDPASLTVAHNNGAGWDQAGTSGSFTGTATAGTVTRTAVTVFSPFSLGNTAAGQNPLPLKFGRVEGYSKNNGVQIDWDTYAEENVSHYEVLRSADGYQFSNIGLVSAKNTPGMSTYSFFDAAPLPGNNFYRIRSVDRDGKFSYSVILHVEPGNTSGDITVYPNPVKGGYLSFQSPDLAKGDYTVKIFNSIGQLVYSQKINHNGGPLSYSALLPSGTIPGIYYLQLVSGEKSIRKNFVVQQ